MRVKINKDSRYPDFGYVEDSNGAIILGDYDIEAIDRLNDCYNKMQEFLETLYGVQGQIERGEPVTEIKRNDTAKDDGGKDNSVVSPPVVDDKASVGSNRAVDGPVDPVAT